MSLDQSTNASRPPPLQFSLSTLLQVMTIAGLWCAVVIVRDKGAGPAILYTVVTFCATWYVVGQWAVNLSAVGCRRVLAALTALLVLGGIGVTALANDMDHLPIVCFVTAVVLFVPWGVMGIAPAWGIVAGIASNLTWFAVVYFVWLAVFRSWDQLAQRVTPFRLTAVFSVLLLLLAVPLLLVVMLSGCYGFIGHGKTPATSIHLWQHCALHVAMFLISVSLIALLLRRGQQNQVPPRWLKLLTWGYLSAYAVLLQVGLFPIVFYIP